MENNMACAQYCIDVIRCVMREDPTPEMPVGVTLQAFFQFARMHSVEALVYHGLSQLDMDGADPIWQNWQNRAEMLLTQSIVQLADRDMLFAAMADAGIDLMPVKGCWLKEAYPQIDYRQMSDLDMLIRKEDRARARSIMLEMGYSEDREEVAAHHDGYQKPPYTAVELHLQLLSSDSRHRGYYDDIWRKAQPPKELARIYRLSAEDEYIYFFLHMERHMEEAGCGIRSILDCMVLREAYPDMDRAYLEREFQKLNIGSLVQRVEELADCWFVRGDETPPHLAQMAHDLLAAGVYGKLDNAFQHRMDELKKRYKNPAVLLAAYWASRFFRPSEEMHNDYPILDRLPFLLPVFWVVRIVKKCFTKPKALLYHVQQIYKEGMKDGKH